MKNYNRIVAEIKDSERMLQDERIELAICIIGYIRMILGKELVIDGEVKPIRDLLTDLPRKLTDILDLLPGSKVKILLNNLDSVGLASLLNDKRLAEVVEELKTNCTKELNNLDFE